MPYNTSMSTKLNPKVEKWMSDALRRADLSNDVKTKVDTDGKYICTPWELCEEIVGQIAGISPLQGKKILVVDTVEFIPVLLAFGAEKCNITYVAPYSYKGASIAGVIGVRVVQQSLLEWKPDMKFDVVVGNPPYTDGTQAANEIYTEIVDRVFSMTDPEIMAMITPENFVNGAQKKKQIREKILSKHSFAYVNFLNQKRDWNDTIKVETAAWITFAAPPPSVIIVGRNSGKKYNSIPLREYVNGEDQNLHDWLQSIQTEKKIKLLQSKKTNKTGKELKISKSSVDSASFIDGTEYESHNNEWRVAFGYMRANTCAIVPPGISIPRKYKYAKFGNNESEARKFASYMLSGPVRLILKLTYTSRTLDNPQLSYVPVIDLGQFTAVTDQGLFDYWKYDIKHYIETLVGDEVPF